MADANGTAAEMSEQLEHVFMPAAERISVILSAIVRLARGDDVIATLARYGAELADELHNDVDFLREGLSGSDIRYVSTIHG
jgi:hypothetical protein